MAAVSRLREGYSHFRTLPLPYRLDKQIELLTELRQTDEWALLILDACRFDSLDDVFDDWFEGENRPVWSAARDTFEYVSVCWPDEYPDVTYVSAAPAINSKGLEFDDDRLNELYGGYVPADHLENIVDVWETSWDSTLGTCPPEAVTRATLNSVSDRLVVHYVQPHSPFIGDERELGHANSENALPGVGDPIDAPIWERVHSGDISDARLLELYRSNLERALRSVSVLIDELPHENVIVTADHGEALGEYGMYAHPRKPHPYVRKVPWATVTGTKRDIDLSDLRATDPENTTQTIESRLKDLGYLN